MLRLPSIGLTANRGLVGSPGAHGIEFGCRHSSFAIQKSFLLALVRSISTRPLKLEAGHFGWWQRAHEFHVHAAFRPALGQLLFVSLSGTRDLHAASLGLCAQ